MNMMSVRSTSPLLARSQGRSGTWLSPYVIVNEAILVTPTGNVTGASLPLGIWPLRRRPSSYGFVIGWVSELGSRAGRQWAPRMLFRLRVGRSLRSLSFYHTTDWPYISLRFRTTATNTRLSEMVREFFPY